MRRERLLAALAAADGAIVLLRAPAGYGKTTLLTQWAAADPRPCAWVALGELAREGGGSALAPADAAAAIDRALADVEPPLLLVLDDAHLLQSADAAALLGLLAERSQLALAARCDPPLPLARLRAERRLLELDAPQLALDRDEAFALLRGVAPDLSDAQAGRAIAAAEGWPAALVLAARALAERDGEDARAPVTGADRLLAGYVREQLLGGLDPAARELLLRGAPLAPLAGELCDAVLGRTGSGLLLRELAHANMPLTALDRAERRFRLHPLVADALLAELRQADPAWEAEAHRRASAWCESRGDLARAVEHALAAGETARAAVLLWPALPAHALGAASGRLDAWLAAAGAEAVAELPALALAGALRRLARGRADEAERLTAAARRRFHELPAGPACPAPASVALLDAALARTGAARMRSDALAALATDPRQRTWRALALLLAGTGELLLGGFEAARERLEDGAWNAASAPLLEALCLGQLALLALDRDEPRRAEPLVRRALACGSRGSVGAEPLFALVPALAAFAHARRGALGDARAALAQARRLLPAGAALPPWHEAELRYALARTLLRLSDAAGARAELALMSRARRRLPDALVLRGWIEDAWARADAFAASAADGSAQLTLAELRVLRLLPSHFSLREIAARLGVSANTVKTQAQAVYRKLDARSRSEAVARAREIGLVESF
ncbi:MAG: hypothetical protein JSS99_14575 [Actinobacteria bacterium]|nr:hypothetical protein [Actinomycetota bacterium]